MARARRSTLLTCVVVVLLVLAGASLALHFREPPDPAAEEFVRAEAKQRESKTRSVSEEEGEPDSSRLGAQDAASATEEEPQDPEDSSGRRDRKKKQEKKSRRDEYGVYYTEDGKIDHSKMPPMGG